jgi:hypothetical protein
VTDFRYCTTNLLTGRLLADSIPLACESFSQQLNGGGTLTASLDLSQDYQVNAPYLAALKPRSTVLWVLADNYPVWSGIVLDQPDMSRSSGTLPISASTIDWLFTKRLITATLEYPAVDIFGVFIDLCRYGTTKTSPYITALSPFHGPASPLVAAAAAVAGLVLPTGPGAVSGTPWSASYPYADLGQVAAAFSTLVSVGLEYAFVPGLDGNGNLINTLYLGFDNGLGRAPEACGYALVYPGNCSDYGYQMTGSQSANFLWASAPPNGSAVSWLSQYPHGVDTSDLVAGAPLMEDTVAWQGSTVTMQSQVDSFSDGQMALRTQAMTTPVINVPDGLVPGIKNLVLGDVFPFAATSPRHPPGPNGEPGLDSLVRLTGWTCYPPGPQQTAYTQLATSEILEVPS